MVHAQTASGVSLLLPTAIVYDSSGNLYIAETNRHVIDRIDASGAVTVVAGDGVQGFSGDSGLAAAAQLDSPQGLAVDSSGNLYIADTHNHRIRMVLAGSGIITTIAGTGVAGFSGDQGQGISARLSLPTALAFDSSGDLYIADSNNHRIRQLHLGSGILSTIAGSGVQADAGDGGPALNASVDTPTGLAVDASHNLYLADTHNHRIRRIDHVTGMIGSVGGSFATRLLLPRGISLDTAGNLYLADTQAHRILRIAPDGTLSTVAGEGTQGFAGDGGPAVTALLDSPRSSAVSPSGLLTLADTGNQRIRQADISGAIQTLSGIGVPLQTALILASPSVVAYGTGSLTASFASSISATGTISFFERLNGQQVPLGNTSLAGNAASFSTKLLPAGPHQLLATYSGDATHLSAQSAVFPLTITPAPLSAAPSNSSAVYGQAIPVLTGSISGVLPQDVSLVSAVFTTTAKALSPAASYPINVTLSGTSAGNYQLTAVSSAFLAITQAPTATALSVSGSTSTQNSAVTFSARAASTTLGFPTGRVTFFDGSSAIGASSLDASGAATFSALLNQGTHSVVAVYSGDGNFLSSSSSAVSAVVSTSPGTTPDFTLTPSGAVSQTTSAGASVVYPFAITFLNGTLDSPILLAVTGMPVGASASFSPNLVLPGTATSNFMLTIQTGKTVASAAPAFRSTGIAISCAMLIILPIGLYRRKTRGSLPGFAAIVLGAACLGCISGCGTSIGTLTQAASKAITYPLTVTATATSATGSALQHTAKVSLIVQ